MSMNETFKEEIVPTDRYDPVANAAGTFLTTGMDMSKFKRACYTIQIGTITGAGTFDANLQSSSTSNFASATNVTNSNITQITNASPNCVVTVEVRADQIMQQNAGHRYLRFRGVVATNTVQVGVVGYGKDCIQKPGTTQGLNTTLLPQQLAVNT